MNSKDFTCLDFIEKLCQLWREMKSTRAVEVLSLQTEECSDLQPFSQWAQDVDVRLVALEMLQGHEDGKRCQDAFSQELS